MSNVVSRSHGCLVYTNTNGKPEKREKVPSYDTIHAILKFLFVLCTCQRDGCIALHLSRLVLNIYDAMKSENTLIVSIYDIKFVMPVLMSKTEYQMWLLVFRQDPH